MLLEDGYKQIDADYLKLKEQYDQIKELNPSLFPSHGNIDIDDLDVLRAMQIVAKTGCEWRDLPSELGNWDTIYMRYTVWEKKWMGEGTYDFIKQEFSSIDWDALWAKHRLTRRRKLLERQKLQKNNRSS